MNKNSVKAPVMLRILKWASLIVGVAFLIAGVAYLGQGGYAAEEFAPPNLLIGAVGMAVFALACWLSRKSIDKQSAQAVAAQGNPQQGYRLISKNTICLISAEGIDYTHEGEHFHARYVELDNVHKFGMVYYFMYKGKDYQLQNQADRNVEAEAYAYILQQWERVKAERPAVKEATNDDQQIYFVDCAGDTLQVYSDYCIITCKRSAWNLLVQDKFFNGEKKFYYADLTSVQFREPGITDGYIEFEYPGSRSGKDHNAYTSENAFQFAKGHAPLMREIYNFIDQQIRKAKQAKTQPVQVAAGQPSNLDELKKLKELLDLGVVTQEEFDAKKSQLLGL